MKIKTSKALLTELNQHKPEKLKNYSLTRATLTANQYSICTSIYNTAPELDYINSNGKYSVFIVSYPDNYYAMSNYITSYNLLELVKKYNAAIDINTFCNLFWDNVKI